MRSLFFLFAVLLLPTASMGLAEATRTATTPTTSTEVAAPQEARLVIDYGENRRELTYADLVALPAVEHAETERGAVVRYRGVLVRDLLALVSAPGGEALRGANNALVVRVRASDGYVVAFALAEFDAIYRPAEKSIFLALTRDGEPLPAGAAPWRFVCPGDQRHSRWIRQVVAIEVFSVRE